MTRLPSSEVRVTLADLAEFGLLQLLANLYNLIVAWQFHHISAVR